jgi:hypothetical protein
MSVSKGGSACLCNQLLRGFGLWKLPERACLRIVEQVLTAFFTEKKSVLLLWDPVSFVLSYGRIIVLMCFLCVEAIS